MGLGSLARFASMCSISVGVRSMSSVSVADRASGGIIVM